jgi:hypothetical protein
MKSCWSPTEAYSDWDLSSYISNREVNYDDQRDSRWNQIWLAEYRQQLL